MYRANRERHPPCPHVCVVLTVVRRRLCTPTRACWVIPVNLRGTWNFQSWPEFLESTIEGGNVTRGSHRGGMKECLLSLLLDFNWGSSQQQEAVCRWRTPEERSVTHKSTTQPLGYGEVHFDWKLLSR